MRKCVTSFDTSNGTCGGGAKRLRDAITFDGAARFDAQDHENMMSSVLRYGQ